MPIPLYELIFDDYTRYHGGTILEPLWNQSPDKPILHVKVQIPTGDFLLLSRYESYNFMIERVIDVYGARQMIKSLPYMYIMGRKGDNVVSYRISLKPETVGDTTVRLYPFGKEYEGRQSSGWHKGGIEEWQHK